MRELREQVAGLEDQRAQLADAATQPERPSLGEIDRLADELARALSHEEPPRIKEVLRGVIDHIAVESRESIRPVIRVPLVRIQGDRVGVASVQHFRRLRAVRLALAVNSRYREDGGQLAAALAYYGFLSLFPLMLLGLAAVGFVLVRERHGRARDRRARRDRGLRSGGGSAWCGMDRIGSGRPGLSDLVRSRRRALLLVLPGPDGRLGTVLPTCGPPLCSPLRAGQH